MRDWKIFRGSGRQHDGLLRLPPPPPWRFARDWTPIEPVGAFDNSEAARARAFVVTEAMVQAVNTALYLRRPLLVTGKPGVGKSTLISKVAHELGMGPALRWPINSRSTVRSGIYEYDAVGRLQSGAKEAPPVETYLTLGPLGTALAARGRPRALLVDEIDKSDLDFANDLLNIIEDGAYQIPELQRLGQAHSQVRDIEGTLVGIDGGRLRSDHFPFIIMTSNAERDFPAAFLRRCVRLDVVPPDRPQLERIIQSQLRAHGSRVDVDALGLLIEQFLDASAGGDMSTDQLLNAVFLTLPLRGSRSHQFDPAERQSLLETLFRPIGGVDT